MFNLPKISRYTRYEKIITLLVLVLLIAHSFVPGKVNVDRYTMMLLGILVLIAVMPSVTSAKLPYILEIKRKLEAAKKKRRK